ncbi:hypothetical protein PJP07_30705, partial [Mycobacterium kansasii]
PSLTNNLFLTSIFLPHLLTAKPQNGIPYVKPDFFFFFFQIFSRSEKHPVILTKKHSWKHHLESSKIILYQPPIDIGHTT